MKRKPPRRPESWEAKLRKRGGRVFCVGYHYIARLKGKQAVADTENDAAKNLLRQFDK